jgi:hypothetical protein
VPNRARYYTNIFLAIKRRRGNYRGFYYPWTVLCARHPQSLDFVCVHCKKRYSEHAGDKCLFDTTWFKHWEVEVTVDANGVGHCEYTHLLEDLEGVPF